MPNAEVDFARSQSTKRITNVLLLLGMVASLVLAFPLMIGLPAGLRDGRPLFFFVPIVAAYVLATVIRKARS